MAAAQSIGGSEDEVNRWLREAFQAERAPARCRLPAPRLIEVAPPARRSRGRVARGSFVLMLALSASALLLQA